MIPYFIIDAGYSVNLFLIMTLLLSYRRKRKTLCFAYICCLLFYITIEIICRMPQIGVSEDVSFVIAGFYEIFVTFFILCIFCQGNIWRNYTFLILDFALINAFTGYLVAFNDGLEEVYDRCIIHGELNFAEASIMGMVHLISGCIVTVILSKIIKREYKGKGRIYMIFSLFYVILGISQLVFKRGVVENSADETVGVAKVVYFIIAVVTFYIFGLLYFKLEAKRLKDENDKLAVLVKENNIRYQELVKTNQMLSQVKIDYNEFYKEIKTHRNLNYQKEINALSQEMGGVPLTGNIVIDSVVKKYYDIARNNNIRCELILCVLKLQNDNVVNAATILENIFQIAIDLSKKSEERWIYLSARKNVDIFMLVAEFPRQKNDKLIYRKSVLSKQTVNTSRLQLIKSLCDIMNGAMDIDNKKEESRIKIAFYDKM